MSARQLINLALQTKLSFIKKMLLVSSSVG